MANPRKFSEKIALHNQKQAEETARFEQIMREVSDATSKVNSLAKQHLRVNPNVPTYRGGSLPSVIHVASKTVRRKIEIPNTQSNFEEFNKCGRNEGQIVYRDRGRSVGVGPMRARTIDKRIDTSPYGGTFLSPPPDMNWRRTNSDSALHQSAQEGGQRRQQQDSQILGSNYNDKSSEQRPKSYYEDSLVPNINIHPSQNEPAADQIPIGNNTGSLPDLSSFHFPSSVPTPLELEDPNSSFSTVQNQQVHTPIQRQSFYPPQRLTTLTVGPRSSGVPHSSTHTSSLQNHLTVPTIITSSYLHQSKGVTQDHSATVLVENYSAAPKFVYPNPPMGPSFITCSLSPPSNIIVQHQLPQQQQINALNTYRNTQPNRPSPQSSPGLTIQQYRSASPGDNYNSAPPSPVSPSCSSGANTFTDPNFFINHAQQAASLQQHFEQFNMEWCQLVHNVGEPGSSWSAHYQMDPPPASITYIMPPNPPPTTQIIPPEEELGGENSYFTTSPSQLQYNFTGSSSTQQTPQTPNTPSSIPDIILTDFSSNPSEDLTKPSLGSAIASSFDSDLLPSDESLRAGLGNIDFDGFQMLTDPETNVIPDPNTEDNFRIDKTDEL